MQEENKNVTENIGETVQAEKNMNIDMEKIDKSTFQSMFDLKWDDTPKTVTRPSQPVIAAKTTSTLEEIVNTKLFNIILEMANMFEHVSGRMNLTVQNQIDTSLDVAAKSQWFYKQHTLQPESISYNHQYQTQLPHQYLYNIKPYYGIIPLQIIEYLKSVTLNPNIVQYLFQDNNYGTWKFQLPNGSQATLLENGSWAIPMANGSWMRVI